MKPILTVIFLLLGALTLETVAGIEFAVPEHGGGRKGIPDMSTFKTTTLPRHFTPTRLIRKPLVIGHRTLISIFFSWIALLAGAFLIGVNVA